MPDKTEDRIPSLDECHELIREHSMLPNIREHSEQVLRVCLAIVDNLAPGVAVNRDLVVAAALLHDITKTRSLETKEPHDASGAALLRGLGFASIASIVEQHVIFLDFNPDGRLEEREIVYYADKRVMHTAIVTVSERVADLVARYGTTPEIRRLITENEALVLAVERKINGFMRIDLQEAIGALQ